MLHAFNQKNVRRVLTSARDEHVVDKNEDGVTSMVFSPLAFMTADAAAAVMRDIVGASLDQAFAGRAPVHHHPALWPSEYRAPSWGGGDPSLCEPDLVVRFEFADGSAPVLLVVEVKWDAPTAWLQAQVDRERRAVAADHRDATLVMLAITKHPLRPALTGAVHRTWVEVHGVASRLASRQPDTATARWGTLVAEFLSRAEQMEFQGFGATLPPVRLDRPVFWQETV